MKNQKGFALLQVVIAASIFSILSLAMGRLIVDQMESVATLEDRLEKIQIIRSIEAVLRDGMSCQKTFLGLKVPGKGKSLKVPSIKDGSGNALYKSNSKFNKLNIGQIEISAADLVSANSSGVVQLIVPISRARSSVGGKHLDSYRGKVMVNTDANKKVLDCASADDLVSSFCASAGGVYNSTTGKCEGLANSGVGECPPGQVSRGIASNGTLSCTAGNGVNGGGAGNKVCFNGNTKHIGVGGGSATFDCINDAWVQRPGTFQSSM